MTIIDTLVTDRTQEDVNFLIDLYSKPFNEWTDEEIYIFLHGSAEILYGSDSQLDATDGVLYVSDGFLRGAYNSHDLNRVGEAVAYLADRYGDITRNTLDVTARTDWTIEDIPTTADMVAYITDIKTIRNSIGAYSTTPAVPTSMNKLTFKIANDIEKILVDADRVLTSQVNNWLYAGEVIAGEV